MALIAYFILLQQGRIAQPLCLLFSGVGESAALFFYPAPMSHACNYLKYCENSMKNTPHSGWNREQGESRPPQGINSYLVGSHEYLWKGACNATCVYFTIPSEGGGDIYPSDVSADRGGPRCVLPAVSGGAPSLLPRTDEGAAHGALNIIDLALPLAAFGGRWLMPGSSASHPAKLSTDQRYGRLTNRMFKSDRHQRPE